MTELETLERARMYMEKLANGINPIDGTPVPNDDVINQVRLSRCFFYVADVLRQVIDNGGVAPKKKPPKAPFEIPADRRTAFAFSDTPIPISEISKRINMLIDPEKMATLPYSTIRDWLFSLNMLEETQNGDGKPTKHPTLQGENLGIHLENRFGLHGPYFVVVYDLAAQHFIIDNLDAIIAFLNTNIENQGKPWTKEDDHCLRDLYEKSVPISEIAITLKRNSGAIRARLKKLNLNP